MISTIHIALLVVSILAIFVYKNSFEKFVPYNEKKTGKWSTGADPLTYYEYNIYKKPYRYPFSYQTSYPYPYRTNYPYSAN